MQGSTAPALATLALLCGVGALRAQDRLVLPVDDDVPAQLKRLEQLAQRGEWDRAVAGLDELLGRGGGTLLPGDPPVTARAEARRRLLALPAEARPVYDDLHAAPARRLLEEGIARADPGALESLLGLHPASDSAEPARRALVDLYAERAQPGAALVHLESLLGLPRGQEELEALRRTRALLLGLAGREGEAREALDALRPGPEREDLRARVAALRPPARPLPPASAGVAWSREVVGYYDEGAEGEQPGPREPWTLAAADAGAVYLHDGSHASALDLRTGKVLWRVGLRSGSDAFEVPSGRCVSLLAGPVVLCALPQGGLAALDRRRGHTLWRRSLNEIKGEAGLELPARLRGRPAVVGGVVVLPLLTGHGDREVHLLALDPHTGRALWRLFVCGQTGGAEPIPWLAAAEERVFVVTGLGAVAAVDARGELVWLRRYRSTRDKRQEGPRGPWAGVMGGEEEQGPPQRDPSALVHRGLLWCAPSDAEGIFAFDARTGEPRGDLPGGEATRLLGPRGAGVVALDRGQLLQVERGGVTRLAKLDGGLRGRPDLVGERAFLPLERALVAVDLQRGSAAPYTTWKAGQAGSVLVAGGRVIVTANHAVTALGEPAPDDLAPEAPALQGLASAAFARREAAQQALLVRGEAAREELAHARQDSPDAEVRLRAGQLLGELDRAVYAARWRPLIKPAWESAVPDLLARLTHPNPEVRLRALGKLSLLPGDPDVPVLLRDLLADPDRRVALVVATGLLQRGDRAGVPVLDRVLAEGEEPERLAAVEALIKAGQRQDVDRLLSRVADPAVAVRAAAAAGALQLGGAEALPRVAALMGPGSADEVRLAIVRGALALEGPIGPGLLELLITASADKNDEVRLEAVTALAKDGVRDPRAYRALGALLGDSVREIARTAAARLHKVAQREDVLLIPADGLERGAALPDAGQRLHVSDIAIQYAVRGGQLTVPTLTRFMLDPEDQVREIHRYWTAPGWADLLLRRAQDGFSAADVTAIQSVTLAEKAHVRHNGFHALALAPQAPGRGPLLARALDDADDGVRARAPEWLVPDQGEDRLDGATLARMFQIAAVSTRAAPAVEQTLARTPPARLVPLLVPLARHREAGVREAAGRRLAAIPGAPAWDPQADPARQAEAFAAWWWGQRHPGKSVEQLVRELVDSNPSTRWRAAQEAAELPTVAVRNALVGSLAQEQQGWVLEEKLAALVAVTGEQHGFARKATPEQQRACVQRFQTWLGKKLVEETAGGGR